MVKAIYEFEIYSNKGAKKVIAESSYKPLWQIRDEVERIYKFKNNIKSSVIIRLVNTINVITK